MDGIPATITVFLTVISMINAAKYITLHCVQVLYISFNQIVFLVIYKASTNVCGLRACACSPFYAKELFLCNIIFHCFSGISKPLLTLQLDSIEQRKMKVDIGIGLLLDN